MKPAVGMESPLKRGRAPSRAPRFLTIERGDVVRVGEEDYLVIKVVRDGRFMVRPIHKPQARDGDAPRVP